MRIANCILNMHSRMHSFHFTHACMHVYCACMHINFDSGFACMQLGENNSALLNAVRAELLEVPDLLPIEMPPKSLNNRFVSSCMHCCMHCSMHACKHALFYACMECMYVCMHVYMHAVET